MVARSGETRYTGVLDAAAKIYREEGWRAFWKGGIARKMRSSPQFGITLVAYELVQRMLFVDFGGTRLRERAKITACTISSSPTGSLRETTPGVAVSSNRDHVGGYAVARWHLAAQTLPSFWPAYIKWVNHSVKQMLACQSRPKQQNLEGLKSDHISNAYVRSESGSESCILRQTQ